MDLIKFLDSISEVALSILDQEDAINKALFSEAPVPNPNEVLSQVYKHIYSFAADNLSKNPDLGRSWGWGWRWLWGWGVELTR